MKMNKFYPVRTVPKSNEKNLRNRGKIYIPSRGRCGRDRMVVGFTTISSYHHLRSNPAHDKVYSIQHYVISLSVTCDRSWFSSGTPVSSNNKTDHHDITEIL
jgi:hypothetical protein